MKHQLGKLTCAALVAMAIGCGGGGGSSGSATTIVPKIGHAAYVTGAIYGVGGFGLSNTTAYYTVNVNDPTPATALYLEVESRTTDTLAVYVGQPTDLTNPTEYDTVFNVTGGSLHYQQISLAAFPASTWGSVNGGDVVVAVHRATAVDASASFLVGSYFSPVPGNFNDTGGTLGSAQPIPTGEWLGATIVPGDIDIFVFSATANTQVTFWLYFPHDLGDLQLELLNDVGVVLSSSDTSAPGGGGELISGTVLTSGTFYVRVSGGGGNPTLEASSYMLVSAAR